MDVLFINPNSLFINYQELAKKYAAIEPPTWALLLAQSCRSKGFKVSILDCNAESLEPEESYQRIKILKPKFLCFVVYGQNVNAGTTNMYGAKVLADYIKSKNNNLPIGLIGSHIQALPKRTLEKEKSFDIGFINEGVYSLHNLLKIDTLEYDNIKHVRGLVIRNKHLGGGVELTQPENIVPQDRMDIDLPGYAWDLLPYNRRPLDLYRSPLWHAEYNENLRSPYAAIQTSIGCKFKCSFCMINIINKNDSKDIGVASNYNNMRYWSPNFIIKEFEKLFKMGVRTIKITDEMFLLNQKYYLPLCNLLEKKNSNDENRIWAYSRVDTVKNHEILKRLRKAGIKWLCLGIESGKRDIRLEVSKGKFEDVNIENIIKQIETADINVLANYIYGLPGDTEESIQETYNLSLKLNTLGWNTYAAMALPGSQLYSDALKKGIKLPEEYNEFSFHSYETVNLPTEKLSAYKILKLRDEKFYEYHKNSNFLNKIEKKFGINAKLNILEMLKVKIKRKEIKN